MAFAAAAPRDAADLTVVVPVRRRFLIIIIVLVVESFVVEYFVASSVLPSIDAQINTSIFTNHSGMHACMCICRTGTRSLAPTSAPPGALHERHIGMCIHSTGTPSLVPTSTRPGALPQWPTRMIVFLSHGHPFFRAHFNTLIKGCHTLLKKQSGRLVSPLLIYLSPATEPRDNLSLRRSLRFDTLLWFLVKP